MGKIFCMMGKSSSGKDTLYQQILDYEGLLLKSIVLYTTRPIRSGEKDGKEYIFADEDMLAGCIEGEIPQACLDYLRESDRPTTIVYPKGRNVASELLAEDGSIGIRITRDSYSNDLCRMLGGAVVSTSANISGEPAAKVYGDISKKILDSVDYVAFSGRDSVEALRPSRVVKLTEDGEIIVLRD